MPYHVNHRDAFRAVAVFQTVTDLPQLFVAAPQKAKYMRGFQNPRWALGRTAYWQGAESIALPLDGTAQMINYRRIWYAVKRFEQGLAERWRCGRRLTDVHPAHLLTERGGVH